ncbi:MAG: DUF3616 domain-containing protein [Okeania sp. SIO2H7]|nr:DUF3616 domain-containing protein [Okeania sp. SIO2H7]
MTDGFLLTRVLMRFGTEDEDVYQELSAAAFTPDGHLWLGSDELLGVERLSQVEPFVFGDRRHFELGNYLELFNEDDEIDIEGMDYSNDYLWFVGSHSSKRKKPKGKDVEKDIEKLAGIKFDLNRFLLGRIPTINGELVKAVEPSAASEKELTAATVQTLDDRNILIESLKDDEHLGIFISAQIPSKENGLDIEGLAVYGDKVFLGLRGPVLRGLAVILEIEVEEKEAGVLTLKNLGEDGKLYKKHFVYLNGMGIRELCLHGEDLIILAGPTMALEALMSVFCLKNVLEFEGEGIFGEDSDRLEKLFDLPFIPGSDRAEGLAMFSCLGEKDALMVVYDSPNERRIPAPGEIFADVFRLPS